MNLNFDDLKVQGIKFNYYFICKRKLWLFSNGISMEDQSDRVLQGSTIHEYSYKNKNDKKEKLIDNMIKIDIIDKDKISEVKISSKMEKSDRMQLLYYLYYLDKSGIKKKGTLNYVKERKVREVELTTEDKVLIEETLIDIKDILNLSYPPKIINLPYCKKCAYYEYCYIKEVD